MVQSQTLTSGRGAALHEIRRKIKVNSSEFSRHVNKQAIDK